MSISIAGLICLLINSGELLPNITRNQIPPTWYSYGQSYYGDNGCASGYWSGQPEDGAISTLLDLRKFGLGVGVIDSQLRIASSQSSRSEEVRAWNLEIIHYQWEVEVQYRHTAWRLLSYASDLTRSHRERLSSLDQLAEHIGREDFFSGIMPAPHPNYRVADTTWKDRR